MIRSRDNLETSASCARGQPLGQRGGFMLLGAA